jgi:hypothetical protein
MGFEAADLEGGYDSWRAEHEMVPAEERTSDDGAVGAAHDGADIRRPSPENG